MTRLVERDTELACDEAAIQALGEGERIPYGKTLLSLIPVRTGPGSPLLSATTMTADKRQLKDRITRIAQGQQTRAAALFLVLALAAGVCAVTFTGAKADGETGGVRSSPATSWRILMRSSSIRRYLQHPQPIFELPVRELGGHRPL